MEYLVSNLSSGRNVKFQGREYIIAPVTLLVPGVLNGSRGPLYYPSEEVQQNVQAWNGMPMVHNHPSSGSARQADYLERAGLGTLFNVEFKSGRLRGEGWFDVERVKNVNPDLLYQLQSGRKIEVSTGLAVDTDTTEGTYNGRNYTGIARKYRPDHLAVLSGTSGACSLEDGCGVNNAKDKGVWRTIRGAKVFIEDGVITKGPKPLRGRTQDEFSKQPTKEEEDDARRETWKKRLEQQRKKEIEETKKLIAKYKKAKGYGKYKGKEADLAKLVELKERMEDAVSIEENLHDVDYSEAQMEQAGKDYKRLLKERKALVEKLGLTKFDRALADIQLTDVRFYTGRTPRANAKRVEVSDENYYQVLTKEDWERAGLSTRDFIDTVKSMDVAHKQHYARTAGPDYVEYLNRVTNKLRDKTKKARSGRFSRTVRNSTLNPDEDFMMCKQELIDQLVENSNGLWTEEDREHLDVFNESKLKALVRNMSKKDYEKDDMDDDMEDDMEDYDKGKGKKPVKNQVSTISVRDLPNELIDVLNYGKQAIQRDKDALIDHLVANMEDNDQRKEKIEWLSNKSICELKQLAELNPVRNQQRSFNDFTDYDYSGQAAGDTRNSKANLPTPMGVPAMDFSHAKL